MLLYAVHHFHHACIHTHLKRVVGEVADFFQWNIPDGLPLGFVTFGLGGKKATYTEQICHVVFRQSPAPPLPDLRKPPQPVLWVRA